MLDFYGYIETVNNIRILNIAKINVNDSFLIDYKEVLNGIILIVLIALMEVNMY